jgi:Alpha amylase, catalytic domain
MIRGMPAAGPVIYEINTWLWLDQLSREAGGPVALDTVPDAEWDRLAAMAIDAVWLMGVWERSPAGAAVMRANPEVCRAASELLADFTPGDLVGSPYCVRRYVPDPRLGGLPGIRAAHQQLHARGVQLLLDFVPNHVAPDHPWVTEHPDYLIQGDDGDLEAHRGEFTRVEGQVVAFGRDPFSAPWTDVVQVNTFHPEVRAATVELLATLAEYCDGVRCDMAMLALTDVFARTWGARAGPVPAREYWSEVIAGIRDGHPGFLFLAEAYWDREWDLLQKGFDYCYDKVLYDRILGGDAAAVRAHLGGDLSYQRRLVRFIENHDEDRVAKLLEADRARAAAVTIAALPGATLYHHGQFGGARRRFPVALGRMPPHEDFPPHQDFYRRLLSAARELRGDWEMCPVTGWPDNQSGRNIVAWVWSRPDATFVVAVNYSGAPAQGQVHFGVPERCSATDLLTGVMYPEGPSERLYVALPAHGFHILKFMGRSGG